MFDWFKKLYGEGKIRADVTLSDGTTAVVRVPYIGDLSTLDRDEFEQDIIRKIWVEHGRRATSVTITGFY